MDYRGKVQVALNLIEKEMYTYNGEKGCINSLKRDQLIDNHILQFVRGAKETLSSASLGNYVKELLTEAEKIKAKRHWEANKSYELHEDEKEQIVECF